MIYFNIVQVENHSCPIEVCSLEQPNTLCRRGSTNKRLLPGFVIDPVGCCALEVTLTADFDRIIDEFEKV